MNMQEREVFNYIANCETSSYTTLYGPQITVVSAKEIVQGLNISIYKVRRLIKGLVKQGIIKRASCKNSAITFSGEYIELISELGPPKNGYTITQQGFNTTEWKHIYSTWCKSMEEWTNTESFLSYILKINF